MTKEEYFGDWSKVADLNEADIILKRLSASNHIICPQLKDIFKSFHLCPLQSLRVVLIGQDPYPNLRAFPWDSSQGKVPVATGLAFANTSDTPGDHLSPSLEVLRESVIDYTIPHRTVTFDPSLEKWEEQGVLLLNSALSCEVGKVGSHTLLWRPFITSFLTNLSKCSTGIVYVLMGSQAQSLEPYINPRFNHVIRIRHPSCYARTKQRMPSDIWQQVNSILISQNGYGIEWYQEY
jgi:uracil-DNA glycosylase